MSQPQMPGAVPQARKTPVWIWILVGILGCIILVVAVAGVAGYYVVKKFAENPQAMVDKFIANNPNIEVVSRDDGAGKITFRDKNTGKSFTFDYEDAKRGRLRLQGDGKNFELKTSERGIEVQDGGKTTRVGAGSARVPAWVPAYPGSSPKASVQEESADEMHGTLAFTTKDPESQVLRYYENSLRGSGYNVETSDNALTANSSSGTRRVHIKTARVMGDTQVAVEFRDNTK